MPPVLQQKKNPWVFFRNSSEKFRLFSFGDLFGNIIKGFFKNTCRSRCSTPFPEIYSIIAAMIFQDKSSNISSKICRVILSGKPLHVSLKNAQTCAGWISSGILFKMYLKISPWKQLRISPWIFFLYFFFLISLYIDRDSYKKKSNFIIEYTFDETM